MTNLDSQQPISPGSPESYPNSTHRQKTLCPHGSSQQSPTPRGSAPSRFAAPRRTAFRTRTRT
eukprot:scaffold659674_cov41-Prasinocladus_malaysianus.AAC.1